MPESRKEYKVTATGLSSGGYGVARLNCPGDKDDGMKVFVEDLLPMETASIALTAREERYAYGEVLSRESSSPQRVRPICRSFEKCGGCCLQHADYQLQRSAKQEQVVNALERIANIPLPVIQSTIQPICGAGETTFYRNHVQYPVRYNDALRSVEIGLYQKNSHTIIEHDMCYLVHPAANTVRRVCEKYWSQIELMDVARSLRQIVVRTGYFSKEMMVILVVSKPVKWNPAPFRDAITAALVADGVAMTLISLWTEERPEQTKWKSPASKWTKQWGEDAIRESIGDTVFRISPNAFFQINSKQVKVLYDTVKKALTMDHWRPRILLDLYCGTGSIGLYLSDVCDHLIGIESVASAIADARENAKNNHIENAEFIAMKAEDYDYSAILPSAVILDPPRKGCDAKLLAKVLDMAPTRIVYVSCHPGSLARDLARLTAPNNGRVYTIKAIYPVDMFPQTDAVETVCLLSKLHEAKHHVRVKLDMDEMDITSAESKATYEEIKKYVAEHNDGMKASSLNIAQVKAKYGIIERENYNKTKSEEARQPVCPKDKEEAIVEALKAFRMI